MYLITVFDKHDAILHRREFDRWDDAMTYLVHHRTGNFPRSLGGVVKNAVSWCLNQVSGSVVPTWRLGS